MAIINVACIKWGTVFGPEYVNRLYSGVRRNLNGDVRFLCMTENSEGLHPDVEVLELPNEPFSEPMNAALAVANRQGAMRKTSLFKPGLIPDLEGPILGFDLDVVIAGDLMPIWKLAEGCVAMRHDWIEARKGVPQGMGLSFVLIRPVMDISMMIWQPTPMKRWRRPEDQSSATRRIRLWIGESLPIFLVTWWSALNMAVWIFRR